LSCTLLPYLHIIGNSIFSLVGSVLRVVIFGWLWSSWCLWMALIVVVVNCSLSFQCFASLPHLGGLYVVLTRQVNTWTAPPWIVGQWWR
jgi:hypothetical protein